MVPGAEDDTLDVTLKDDGPVTIGRPVHRKSVLKEQTMQIDMVQFLIQAVALIGWVLLAAAVYSIGEKALGGPAPSGGE